MRKKVDERIRTLIENGVKSRHRSMFLIIGDKHLNQIINLHYMLTKAVVKSRPSILWCFKNKRLISSNERKLEEEIKKLVHKRLLDAEMGKEYKLFVDSAKITNCKYRDSDRILGNTFGMCILQDFETLTPNLLARTIETVEGGGIILLLLQSLSSLTSLYTMVMDVHNRYRTESHTEVAGRFNERFLLSLSSCKACLVVDDELNILPISSHMKSIKPVPATKVAEGVLNTETDLKILKDQLSDEFQIGPLIRKCCTLDQGKAVMTCLNAILDKTLPSTIALLASRGRGKSAALGLAIAGAVAAGYSNIFLTAPSTENLKTVFEFVCKGFDALEYKEHSDYDAVKIANSEFKKTTIRIDIFKQHKQTIQYIQPHEYEKLLQAELLVVDEAAAIPLPVVKSLLGPYLVFFSSTVNGYEGTGRSLSLKLLHQLEEQSQMSNKNDRLFKKIELSESIRYASGDSIESWLNGLLCLDATNFIPGLSRLPLPSECDLYYVNRDTLFSYHRDSELFLQRMMALYVASHYKNSPNDLQLMADAPGHHLFVLLGPVDESNNHLPDILCVIQICFEGKISREFSMQSLSNGKSPQGDQIEWKFCEQFRDQDFPSLSGVRIVHIATHPRATRHGYGSTAVELLARYFEGYVAPIFELEVQDVEHSSPVRIMEAAKKVSLLEENVQSRANLPPLLVHLRERKPEKIHYIGVSFGLTLDLLRFWKRHKFAPFYIEQFPNIVTGEHTCMMLKPLNNDDVEMTGPLGFFTSFYQEFRRRFILLLASSFRSMEHKLALSILDPKIEFVELEPPTLSVSCGGLTAGDKILTPSEMKRLEDYTNNQVNFDVILDFVPKLSEQYFSERIPVTISSPEASVLVFMGLQRQNISYIEEKMKIERELILFELRKVMKKFHKYLYDVAYKEIDTTPAHFKEVVMEPHEISVDEDLNEAAKKVKEQEKMKAKIDYMDPELLQKYAINEDRQADLGMTLLQNGSRKLSSSGLLSVKSSSSSRSSSSRVMKTEKERDGVKLRRCRNEEANKDGKKRKKGGGC